MLGEFRAFIARGNVLDLAIAVIIGGAFGVIVSALTDDIIMPVIGVLTGGLDFSSYFLILGEIPNDYVGSLSDYAALKAVGVAILGYGTFLTAAINFVIIAAAIFLLIKIANRATSKKGGATPSVPDEIVILREIHRELKVLNQRFSSATGDVE